MQVGLWLYLHASQKTKKLLLLWLQTQIGTEGKLFIHDVICCFDKTSLLHVDNKVSFVLSSISKFISTCQYAGENNIVVPPHFTILFNITPVMFLSFLFLMVDNVSSLFHFFHFLKSHLTFPSCDPLSSLSFFSGNHGCTIFSQAKVRYCFTFRFYVI